jgi:hypothetical protein
MNNKMLGFLAMALIIGPMAASASVVLTPFRAPEIDPASAVSALTLLFGGLAVLRGRRKS